MQDSLIIEGDYANLNLYTSRNDNYIEVSLEKVIDCYINLTKEDCQELIKFMKEKFKI